MCMLKIYLVSIQGPSSPQSMASLHDEAPQSMSSLPDDTAAGAACMPLSELFGVDSLQYQEVCPQICLRCNQSQPKYTVVAVI